MKNTVTLEQIETLLNEAETEKHVFFGKATIIMYKLKNGFTVYGYSACVDPANFDEKIGDHYAREDAKKKLWQLEGYLLQNKLNEARQDKRG